MPVINYAIEVITDTDYDYGALALADGVFRYITGTPGYDGNAPYPKWEDTSDNTHIWYEGWLLKDSIGNPSRSVEIAETGSYGTFSGFNFSIRNDLKMWKYLRDNAIFLTNRYIKLYTVIDGVFYSTWMGVISNEISNDIEYEFQCIDQFKKIHKIMPPNSIFESIYPGSIAESQGEAIPVSIGNITYAKLQTISTEPYLYDLNDATEFYNGVYPTKAAASVRYLTPDGTNAQLHIYTVGYSWGVNGLAGKYVFCCKGGGDPDTDQLIRIESSDATTAAGITVLYLGATFDSITAKIFNKYYTIDPNITYTQINNGHFQFVSTVYSLNNSTQISTVNSWVRWAHIDMTNQGNGCNVLHIYLRTKIDLFCVVHKGVEDGPEIGRCHFSAGYPHNLYRCHIDLQDDDDVGITLQFVDKNDNPVPFNSSSWAFNWFQLVHTTSCDETWWFSITDMANELILSTSEIESFERDSAGRPLLFTWDENKQEMISASHLIKTVDATTTSITGHPQISLVTSKIQKDGSVRYTVPLSPQHWSTWIHNNRGYIQHNGNQIYTLNDIQAIGSSTQISDRNMTTGLEFHLEYPGKPQYNENLYDCYVCVTFPPEHVDEDYDDLFIGVDFDIDCTEKVKVLIGLDILDAYGNLIVENFPTFCAYTEPRYPNQIVFPISEVPKEKKWTLNMLNSQFYDNGGVTESGYESDWAYSYEDEITGDTTTLKSMMMLDKDITDALKDRFSSNIIRLTFTIMSSSGEVKGAKFSGTFKIKQIGFVGIKSMSILNDTFYARIKGEKVDGESTSNVYRTFQHILESYDGIPSTDILYNNLPDSRSNWPVGRQITDRKDSFQYLSELCSHTLVSIYPTRTGKRGLKAWRDDTTIKATLSEEDIIRNSYTFWKNTEMSSIYNDFRLEYNENPATGKFFNSIIVTNTDQAAFPAADEMLTNPSVAKWKTYVGGLPDNCYTDAKQIWEVCQGGYERAAAIQQAPADISKLYWFNSSATFSGLDAKGVSTSDSSYKFLKELIAWTTRQKTLTQFSLPVTGDNIRLELLDYINISDLIYSDDEIRVGWIVAVEVNTTNDTIGITCMLDVEEDREDNLIIEDGVFVTDGTRDESGARDDQDDDGQGRI